MDFPVDLAWCVHKSKIVPVDHVLEDEVETSKGSDEGAGDGEHDDHGEDEHHPGILLAKPELIPELKNSRYVLFLRPDGFSDAGSVCFATRDANLDQVPEQLREPVLKEVRHEKGFQTHLINSRPDPIIADVMT